MNRYVIAAIVVAAVALGAILAHFCWPGSGSSAGERAQVAKTVQWDGSPSTLFASHRGHVLVLLAGMEGCPGTGAATAFLKDYSAKKEPGVSIVRLDVPPPGGTAPPVDAESFPFGYAVDEGRVVADQLEFFYYPTLYIVDRDGEIRFAGECDPDSVPKMVSAILTEKPGDPKTVYTPPLPAVGATAQTFSGTTLDGKTVSLDKLRGENGTVLVFAKTNCPFSVEALPTTCQLADEFRDKQVAVVIVNNGEPTETIRPVYTEKAPQMTVIDDGTGEISTAYSGDLVPYAFVLDGDGRIAARMPYTLADATRAVNDLLGTATGGHRAPTAGAG